MVDLEKLELLLALKELTVEERIEADQLVLDIQALLAEKEVVVEEPTDIDEPAVMTYTREQLEKLREPAVVAIANELGIDATTRDKKADTVEKILAAQEQRGLQ